jgi:hypothetical protein
LDADEPRFGGRSVSGGGEKGGVLQALGRLGIPRPLNDPAT